MIQLRRAFLLAFAVSAVVVTNALGAGGGGAGTSQSASVHSGPVVASVSSAGPTPGQIRKAVQQAIHSPKLWTTINICDRPHGKFQNAIGIRGQMPTLGFRTSFVMKIVVRYWDPVTKKFLVDTNRSAQSIRRPPAHAHGFVQDGFTFFFKPPLLLSGQVTFKWIYQGKVIGQATAVHATAGHHHVDGGMPKGYSAATCRIRKP